MKNKGRTLLMKNKSRTLLIYGFLIIPLIHLIIFSYVPIIGNFIVSFTDWKGFGEMKFVGLRNYQRMFTNTEYIKMFKNCGWYFLVAIPQLIFAFILAVVINGKFRGINIFKGIFIIPYLLNGVIISTIFIIFFNNTGSLNVILEWLHLDGLKHQWLQDLRLVNPAIASISIWRYYGMNFIMFFGALQAIPQELYEAATLDGCNKWIPELLPVFFDDAALGNLPGLKLTRHFRSFPPGAHVSPAAAAAASAAMEKRCGPAHFSMRPFPASIRGRPRETAAEALKKEQIFLRLFVDTWEFKCYYL